MARLGLPPTANVPYQPDSPAQQSVPALNSEPPRDAGHMPVSLGPVVARLASEGSRSARNRACHRGRRATRGMRGAGDPRGARQMRRRSRSTGYALAPVTGVWVEEVSL